MSERIADAPAAFLAEVALGSALWAITAGTVGFPLWFVGTAGLALVFGRALPAAPAALGACVGPLFLIPVTVDRTPEAELGFLAYPLVVGWVLVLSLGAIGSRRLLSTWRPSRNALWGAAAIALVLTVLALVFPLLPLAGA